MSAVGIFDSGLGGLCAVRELRALLPEQDILYFGDTARLPYGTRSADAISRYAAQDAAFLLKKKVSAILVACGTVSSAALPKLAGTIPVPILGVVEPAAREAAGQSKNRCIGVLGTRATVESGAYERALRFFGGEAVRVVSVACPLLVPLVENGETDGEMARIAVREYLREPISAGCDTLLLGCTHYPLLSDIFHELAPGMALIDAGKCAAGAMAELLRREHLAGGSGKTELYTSDFSQGFSELAARFLQDENAHFMEEKVAVETWE